MNSKKFIEQWKAKDDLIYKSEMINKYKDSISAEIEEAIQFAEQSTFPDEEDLYKDVF